MYTKNKAFNVSVLSGRQESGSDPLIKEMEKFMSKDSVTTRPLRSNTKVLDIKKLCNILEDKDTNSDMNKKKSGKGEKADNHVSHHAKKKKLDENNNKNTKKYEKNSEKLKHDSKNKEKMKKNSENKERSKNGEMLFKNVKIMVGKVSIHSKTPIATKIYSKTNKSQKETKIISRTELTKKALKSHTAISDAVLRYAKNKILKDKMDKECKLILPPLRKRLNAKLNVVENYLHTAIIYKPDVRYYHIIQVIDLTKECDEEELKIISEKECANKIFRFVYEFYNYYPIEKPIQEVAEILDTDDYCLNIFFTKGIFLGLDLIKELRYKRIRNFDLTRFLNFIVFKLEQTFKVMLAPLVVALYLHLMLRPNKKSLDNKLLERLFDESTKMLQMERVKVENKS